ncbi:hypothetical protein ABES02_25195 [Neobacillus pocheonensis]|uniref:hypothetical protein n=1 Tax=Neobacillus pocheonensis TaxID=363869 RepID=UPI003D2E337A
MKIKEYFFIVLVPLIALVAIILRLTHTISSGTFGTIGFILAIIGFVRSTRSDTLKKEEHLITGLKELFNPIKRRYNFVVGCVIFIGIFYLLILILSIFGQL